MQRSWQQWMLDHDLTVEDLRQAVEISERARSDDVLARELRELDRLRDSLRSPETPDPVEGWEGFEQRLLEQSRSGAPQRRISMRRAAGWTLAAAAVVAAAVTTWSLRQPSTPLSAPPPNALLPAETDQQVEAFRRVTQLFDGRATWVAFSKGEAEMGLAAEPVAETHGLLLLRLTLTHRGEVAAQTDLAVVPGQTARLSLPLPDGATIQYVAAVSDQSPQRLALWVELNQANGLSETLGALATNLTLRDDGVLSAGEMVTSNGAYRLTVGSRNAPWGRWP